MIKKQTRPAFLAILGRKSSAWKMIGHGDYVTLSYGLDPGGRVDRLLFPANGDVLAAVTWADGFTGAYRVRELVRLPASARRRLRRAEKKAAKS